MKLLGELLPRLPDQHSQGQAMLIALMLLLFGAQEYERGAEIRSAENADMRALFAELAPLLRDEALKRE